MKAVIVIDIDMPTKCDNCYFVEEWFNEYGEKVYYCPLHRMTVPKNGDVCKELRPLPQEREFSKQNTLPIKVDGNSFVLGWNACLKETIGEN